MSKFDCNVGGYVYEFDLATNPAFVRYWLTQHEYDAKWEAGHSVFYAAMAEGDAIGAYTIMQSELAKLAEFTMSEAAEDYGDDAADQLYAQWFREEAIAKREAARIAAQFEADAQQAHYDHVCERGAA